MPLEMKNNCLIKTNLSGRFLREASILTSGSFLMRQCAACQAKLEMS